MQKIVLVFAGGRLPSPTANVVAPYMTAGKHMSDTYERVGHFS